MNDLRAPAKLYLVGNNFTRKQASAPALLTRVRLFAIRTLRRINCDRPRVTFRSAAPDVEKDVVPKSRPRGENNLGVISKRKLIRGG